jgi:hypothetical protein
MGPKTQLARGEQEDDGLNQIEILALKFVLLINIHTVSHKGLGVYSLFP